jgi:predicted HicB family RNase H-like nuclease
MQLNYRIPDDLHRALKVRAAQEGVTLKALVIRLLSEAVGMSRIMEGAR